MIANVATDPNTGRQVIVANFESFRKQLEDNIDKACNEFLNEPDWNKNFEIYDALNRTAYLCPFAVAAIRRKLKTKNPEIEVLALHLLEGMIKNVPSSHGAVSQPSFMRYLIKVGMDTRKEGVMKSIGKKFKKDAAVNSSHFRAQAIDKALLIIQMLNNAYENSNTYPIFVDTYKQLKKQGVRFPVLTKDEDATVFAPIHSARMANYGKNGANKGGPPSAMGSLSQSGSVITNHVNIDRSLPMIRPVVLIADLYHNDLKTAQENAKFFFEMVNASEPGSNLLENDLIQQLYTSTKEWQQRVQMIIQDPNCNEIVMSQGFEVNEIINNVLSDYNELLTNTKRRYEEPLGDIEKLASSDANHKNNDSTDEYENSINKNKTESKTDDEEGSNVRKSISGNNFDIGIAPPPNDEGAKTHHARKHSRRKNGPKSNKNDKNENSNDKNDDLLDLFDSSANGNGLKANPPNLSQQQSSMGIFDLMAIPSGPVSNFKPQVAPSIPLTTDGTMPSASNNISAPSAPVESNDAFDSLGDPFGSGSVSAAVTTTTSVAAPSNNVNNSNSSNPFSGLTDDPFSGLTSNTTNNTNTMNTMSTNTNVKNNNKTEDFMGGGDNPFDMFASSTTASTGNNNNNNNKNNNTQASSDFLGGDSNPFADL